MEDMEIVKRLSTLIQAWEKAKKEGRDGTNDLLGGLKELGQGVEETRRGVDQLGDALGGFSKLAIDGQNSLSGLVSSLTSASAGIKSLGSGLTRFPLLGKAFEPLIETMGTFSDLMTGTIGIAKEMAEAYDSVDKGTRDLTKTQYGYAAGLGLTFDHAVKNTSAFQGLIKANSELSARGIYFDSADFKRGVESLQQAGIAMEDLTRASGVAGGLNNMQAMSLQAKAMGMDVGEYSRKISDMVRKNGLSIEDSMKLMASSQSIAGETGLKIDEVTQSLESATSGFQRMGATMDFGRPVLKGFADSIKDVGLGISQAGDLAAEFSKSLIGIVNNPALAYVTAMKGGFAGAMGGPGGVLNPSIQMQAMMLNQEPGAQAELASNLSMGMREMLKSQAGGEIITVREAAAGDASTQSRFYQQQQMLGSIYGISDTTTQSRVLEYLEDLEKATAEGNEEQIEKINQQIADATEGNDKTFDLQQKISQTLDKSLILAQDQLNVAKAGLIAQGFESGGNGILDKLRSLTDISEQMLAPKLGKDELAALEADYKTKQEELFKETKQIMDRATGKAETPPPTAGTGVDARIGASGVANANTIPAGVQRVEIGVSVSADKGYTATVDPASVAAAAGNVRITETKKP
jgi:hypothetical protein